MGFFDFGFSDLLRSATSLFGGAVSAKGIRDTNKTNLQIARETNQANRENQRYQNEWNLNMWNAQNEYNSPDAQRQRLEDAGLNPIFYGLDGTGNAGALTSSPFTAVNGAPMENSGAPMGEALMNLVPMLSQAKLADAQADNISEDTESKRLNNFLLGKTMDNQIELSNLSVIRTKAGIALDQKNADLAQARIDEINNNINYVNESFQLMLDQFDFEKEKFDFEKEIRTRLADIEEARLDNETKRLTYDIAIGWYKAYQEDKRIQMDFAYNKHVIAGLRIDNYVKYHTRHNVINISNHQANIAKNASLASEKLPDQAQADVQETWARVDEHTANARGQEQRNSTYYVDNFIDNCSKVANILTDAFNAVTPNVTEVFK